MTKKIKRQPPTTAYVPTNVSLPAGPFSPRLGTFSGDSRGNQSSTYIKSENVAVYFNTGSPFVRDTIGFCGEIQTLRMTDGRQYHIHTTCVCMCVCVCLYVCFRMYFLCFCVFVHTGVYV